MKRILISGGAGFIGSHLCERLLIERNDVIRNDNYFTGLKSNIRHLLKHPNFEVIRHDIVYPYMAEVEEIYNLACPASPIYYQHDPIKTTQTSVIGAMNMLAIANRNHAKILQASTSEVYGDPLIHPQPEDYWGHVNPLGLRSCYDEGKRCAESLFMSYYREHGVPVKIVRIFNTYGPKMDINDGRVVSNFIVQALRGEQITIYGNGEQTRSFQYIDDLVEGMLRMMTVTPDDFTGPVISATRTNSRSPSWRTSSSNSPDPNRKSSACPCRRTTRSSANPTSPSPTRCSATGNRRSSCATDC